MDVQHVLRDGDARGKELAGWERRGKGVGEGEGWEEGKVGEEGEVHCGERVFGNLSLQYRISRLHVH